MTDTVKELRTWPVNSSGEIVASAGVGDTTVVGQLPASFIPVGDDGTVKFAGLTAAAPSLLFINLDKTGNMTVSQGLAPVTFNVTTAQDGGTPLFDGTSTFYFEDGYYYDVEYSARVGYGANETDPARTYTAIWQYTLDGTNWLSVTNTGRQIIESLNTQANVVYKQAAFQWQIDPIAGAVGYRLSLACGVTSNAPVMLSTTAFSTTVPTASMRIRKIRKTV